MTLLNTYGNRATMKRIMKFIVILSILACCIFPVQSFAVTSAISDSELDGICGQVGAISVRIGNFVVESQNLKNISTDGWNYWDPDHGIRDPHPDNAPGFFDGSSTTNPQKHPGTAGYNQVGYFGYDESYIVGGAVNQTGSMVLEVVSTTDPNILSQCKLEVLMRQQTLDAQIGFGMVLKLSDSPDLSGTQSLGRIYTQGIKASTNGHLTVYAHNNPLSL